MPAIRDASRIVVPCGTVTSWPLINPVTICCSVAATIVPVMPPFAGNQLPVVGSGGVVVHAAVPAVRGSPGEPRRAKFLPGYALATARSVARILDDGSTGARANRVFHAAFPYTLANRLFFTQHSPRCLAGEGEIARDAGEYR